MFQPTKEWVNKVNLSSFELENFFKFGACVISARKAKQLNATTMFTYSHANTPLGQSECTYYLSYFIKNFVECPLPPPKGAGGCGAKKKWHHTFSNSNNSVWNRTKVGHCCDGNIDIKWCNWPIDWTGEFSSKIQFHLFLRLSTSV